MRVPAKIAPHSLTLGLSKLFRHVKGKISKSEEGLPRCFWNYFPVGNRGLVRRLERNLQLNDLFPSLQAIDLLVKQHRKGLITKAFGADRGRIKPFREEDRGEDSD
jgi:hypothetical protein